MNFAGLRFRWPHKAPESPQLRGDLQVLNDVLYLISVESKPDRTKVWVDVGQEAVQRLACVLGCKV
jgi:hypothetical protein